MSNIDVDDHSLISSARVEGTAVYDRRAEKIGTIHSVMIDKVSGQVRFAILSFGGIFGIGARVYPLPWALLDYDPKLRGYSLSVTREDVEAAPYMALDKADRPHEVPEPAYRHWDEYL
ncbi:PRC-barrel domain-containing protein [Stakelama saccharophila]|uniref:PRC-barrel domain-containing protein n=1 Tax=Stakelama saccharophila TaxID=3075605 RepID=A0ABZ0B911_9SPHN|nr:PRC-barrel domain-containing protein [Stakelama sp. W311]WNO53863.1 PRC-barrel domain-containing protein [Stakelama sp. W311]